MKVLVTGGGGFLGGAIVRALLARGDTVSSLARGDHPELRRLGVRCVRGDLVNPAAVRAAAQGCDLVMHVAAKAGIWGSERDFRRTNVDGTACVIDICRELGIRRLVHTSTPSVVHAGGDIAGGDESLPYPSHFTSAYPRTKAAAERLVLAANGPDLATVALRPHLIWGPGDTQLVPGILDRARAGRLRFVGGGRALVDSTYLDSAVEAHLLAADRLAPGAACAGRAYFISQGEPLPVMDLTNAILAAAGMPPVAATVPVSVGVAAGAAVEALWWATRRRDDPPITRFLARQLATAHWFDISAARRDLGYGPRVSLAEGLVRLAESLQGGQPAHTG